jgi:hypothetical protein
MNKLTTTVVAAASALLPLNCNVAPLHTPPSVGSTHIYKRRVMNE